MCGLIGEWRWGEPARPLPLTPLAHRGPDGQGSWHSDDQHCWLGHTRLAILDRSAAGAQPIHSHCGRLTLVFNGEIYNHLSLRPSLAGIPWRGHSDSETLVEALARDGLQVLARLQGMYAFAAYDRRLRQLWLGRDPFGIKPLYLARRDGLVRFASERRALDWPADPSPQELAELLAWGHLSTPTSLPLESDFGPFSLPAGTVLQLGSERPGRLQLERSDPLQLTSAWRSSTAGRAPHESAIGPDHRGKPLKAAACAKRRRATQGRCSRHTTTRRLRASLEAVVADHLLADVPLACFLSSGLDSGILTALACRVAPGTIRSFTVAFPDQAIDEGEAAARMARHCGSEHHSLTLSEAQAIAWVEQGLRALDVPSADGLNTYVISRAVAAQGIRVALSGLGADELFGGYPSHRLVPWLQTLSMLPRSLRTALLNTLVPRLGRKLAAVENWAPWQLSLALRRWADPIDLQEAGLPPLRWPAPPQLLPRRRWDVISCAELLGYTEPMLLRDSDALSMACGLEVRVPFLDLRLQRLVRSLPAQHLRPGKSLLRQACLDLFPPGHLDRPKRGFSLPMASWMRGPLRPLCQERLAVLASSGWLREDWLQRQWLRFEAGQLNWPRAWILVVLGEFATRATTPQAPTSPRSLQR